MKKGFGSNLVREANRPKERLLKERPKKVLPKVRRVRKQKQEDKIEIAKGIHVSELAAQTAGKLRYNLEKGKVSWM